jgi:DNA-binding NtrC family response regulator
VVLAPAAVRERVGRVAAELGLDVEAVDTVSGLLAALEREPRTATFVSFSVDAVDESVVDLVASYGRGGALILSAPALSLRRAVAVERAGALALLREPVDEEDLRARLDAVGDEGPEVAIPALGDDDDDDPAPVLIGEGREMATVFGAIARVARSDATVLITGESGTGKEVVARALHWASERTRGPFVAVNCAAIPENLLESELFGHERGAFTGAVARRAGRFERANGGTLFLDEIGDMSLVLQAKILRALEDRVVERVGAESGAPVDVRVVAATNQELEGALRTGAFREDLYYRLAVVQLHLPPLRDRGHDVRALSLHFASHFARRHGRPVTAITERALRRLERERWAGNVRELRNVMDRAVLLATGPAIRSSDLRVGPAAPRGSARGAVSDQGGYAPSLSLEEVESDHIRRVLAAVGGHMGQAAEVLGIHRNTLTRKMRDYGIGSSP